MNLCRLRREFAYQMLEMSKTGEILKKHEGKLLKRRITSIK